MGRTANLRRQHEAAAALAGDIVRQSHELDAPGVPYAVSLALARLTGLLRIHIMQEERTLFPGMIASGHIDAARTAETFRDDVKLLAAQYEDFARRWSAADRLAADPAGFRKESRAVFAALAARMERENAVLYPLADALDALDAAPRRSAA